MNKTIKLLKIINKIYQKNNDKSNVLNTQKGRIKTYDDFSIFKIYLLMNILNIKSIKGIWKYLNKNKKVRQLCGLTDNLDRTTLNRRLNSKYKEI